jgi:threonylcarbamoyladenosine tRNA methylthiotransferase MtaB
MARRLAAEVGKQRSVLIERPGFGRTDHFIPVALDGGEPGEIIRSQIRSAGPKILSGRIFEEAA